MKTPNHAAKIWHADGRFYAELGGHTVHFRSYDELIQLLRHRTAQSKLATRGDLTQWQIDNGRQGADDLFAEFREKGFQPARKRTKYSKEQRKAAVDLLKRAGLTI